MTDTEVLPQQSDARPHSARFASARPGDRIAGRYELGASLGRGGMAEVFRAHDPQTGRDVAVKLFRSDVAEARDLRRIRSEIRMLAGLNHPSLVHLYDASTGDERTPAYLVLELVDGPTLADLMEDGIPADELAVLLSQTSDALAYIHARGIVHRDVKPENILVSRDPYGRPLAKLADLGIARIVDESRITVVGGVIGTAAYLSPEQVTGEHVGTASDVYALGLVLFEGLTGRRAFDGSSAESAVARTVRPPRLPGGLGDRDADLLARMTALDADSRVSALEARERLLTWSSIGPFQPDDPTTGLRRAATAATELLTPPMRPESSAATERLGVVPSELPGGSAGQPTAATRVLPAAATSPHPDFRSSSVTPPTSATELFAPLLRASRTGPAESTATEPSGWVPTRPALEPEKAARAATRVPKPRSLRRRIALILTVLVVLGVATVAIWPTAASILAPAPVVPPPAYPTIDGELGTHLVALQTSLEGGGLATDSLADLRADALAVGTAAAVPDLDAASTALDAMSVDLDASTVDDRVTSARYRVILQALNTVDADLETAIAAAAQAAADAAAAQAAAEAAAAREAAAQEAARQQAEEEAARQAAEDAQNSDDSSESSESGGSGVLSGIQSWWQEQQQKLRDQLSDSGSGDSGSGNSGSGSSGSGD
ncbi:serine/threonine-protein kinase [Naasia lichenicola]|uniref:non-specific serine/threonine protein kinase n=1 Tax=Naasia lichenicola TaxID=2565933 RepID=A0A4S4FSD1_9MICO|nr:serine/threonine-protein kinase [Naasia lichenicola]THG32396.1 hypothetical protein E6C64_05110 [Naasia lichenicola]